MASNASVLNAVDDTTDPPWCSIAHLDVSYENGSTCLGTAWFFSPRGLATAGHNIFHADNGAATEIRVTPAFDGTNRPFQGPYVLEEADMWCDPRRMAGTTTDELDYGALRITDPTASLPTSRFTLEAYDDGQLDDLQIEISGYAERAGPRTQYHAASRLEPVERRFLRYRIDTVIGMSGGPIFARVGGQHVAVGIHTGKANGLGWARRIDAGVRDALREFAGP